MTTMKIHSILSNYLDNIFGEYAPTDTDIELVDAIIAANLPDDIDWAGDELQAPVDTDYDGAEIWEAATDAAADAFYGIGSEDEYRAVAESYGVDVPDDYVWGENAGDDGDDDDDGLTIGDILDADDDEEMD